MFLAKIYNFVEYIIQRYLKVLAKNNKDNEKIDIFDTDEYNQEN